MHYLIDGYNLIFQSKEDISNLSSLRKELIQDLAEKSTFLNLHITLVFDSHFHPSELSRSHISHLEVIFTNENQSADECLIDLIDFSKNPKKITLVTDDKTLRRHAKSLAAQTLSTQEFQAWLFRRFERLDKPFPKAVYPLPSLKKKYLNQKSQEQKGTLFEFYLDIFEKKVAEEKTGETLKKSPPQKRETDFERWLKAFNGA